MSMLRGNQCSEHKKSKFQAGIENKFLYNGSPRKAEPSVRMGQKVAALLTEDGRTAEALTFGKLGLFASLMTLVVLG
jgi:hypothetical protein